ncbi:MAG: DUF2933 domain-containing protein [Chloroflexi bacterium]|nr:DUF2933 domain-containing protein [Chloroflexota bacterium]
MDRVGKMCLNWKVIAGLAAVGVVAWVAAPSLVVATLPLLLLAACPISMLLMMRAMQGMPSGQCTSRPEQISRPSGVGLTRDEQIVALKGQLASVQVQQEAIAREIARLESLSPPNAHETEVAALAGERAQGGKLTPGPLT